MLIGNNWKIESDALNVILYEKVVGKKSGKEYWKAHSYYSSFHNALDALIDMEIGGTGLDDLKAVDAKIEELKGQIATIKI